MQNSQILQEKKKKTTQIHRTIMKANRDISTLKPKALYRKDPKTKKKRKWRIPISTPAPTVIPLHPRKLKK